MWIPAWGPGQPKRKFAGDATRLVCLRGHDRVAIDPSGGIRRRLVLAQSAQARIAEEGTMRISGAAAIVTGGGSGLGRATAEALAAKGARVAIFDLDPAAAEEAAKSVSGVAVVCDVGDDASAAAAVAEAEAAHGPARILVNCAGIGNPVRIVGKDGAPAPLGDFEEVVRVNLIGTFNMIRLAAAGMARLDAI